MTYDFINPLINLGFTGLEAEVYVCLLQQSPMTGYRVAQAISKPTANVYKAIETLHQKGAVIIDDSSNRLCRATPAEELLSRLDRDYQDNQRRAAEALAKLQTVSADDRIYQLRSYQQVMERCRQMLLRGKQVALIDVFPHPLEELRPDIEAAVSRGLDVAVGVYQPTAITGTKVFVQPHGQSILEKWPGQWVNMVVDGLETLLAFLTWDGKGVHQAIWSGSAYLSCVYHSALGSEMILGDLQKQIENGGNASELQQILGQHRRHLSSQALGYDALVRRFTGSHESDL